MKIFTKHHLQLYVPYKFGFIFTCMSQSIHHNFMIGSNVRCTSFLPLRVVEICYNNSNFLFILDYLRKKSITSSKNINNFRIQNILQCFVIICIWQFTKQCNPLRVMVCQTLCEFINLRIINTIELDSKHRGKVSLKCVKEVNK